MLKAKTEQTMAFTISCLITIHITIKTNLELL